MTERIMTETERDLLSNYLAADAPLGATFGEACAWGLCGILDHAEECESQPGGMGTWGIGGHALTLGTDTEDDADQAEHGSAP